MEEACLDLRMWSRDENVGQSDSGRAGVPVDELCSLQRREASLMLYL